ncbi:MAG: RNA-binding protein [Lachnospiraceae bacterium]|nr:RNA-binding protein [Lachnospiraceae bacterium]
MFHLGELQELQIVKLVDFGAYLAELDAEEKVLLPAKQLPAGAKVGDRLEVFLYRDSQDRMIATLREPLLMLGQVAELQVVSVSRMGAFLDWGLEKDLFLPYRQQTKRVKEGEKVLVSLYVDKSSRLCATMNVYHELRTDAPYRVGDEVEGIAYEQSEKFGIFVAVDGIYSAIIPRHEVYGEVAVGDHLHARVTKVREDGRLNLSVREKAYMQMYPDMERILELLKSYGGVLPFTEKADPEVIRRETDMSKSEFKRAVGHLYKQRKIQIEEGKIRLAEEKGKV